MVIGVNEAVVTIQNGRDNNTIAMSVTGYTSLQVQQIKFHSTCISNSCNRKDN